MQTPGSVTSRTNMVDSATARMSSAKTALNLEKVNKNLIQLRNEFRADIRDRGKFEEKRAKLLKKEETSLTGLKAATFNLRTIIGAASGASALRQFSQGNVGGGLQETGIAVAAFIPEIIDITSKIVVGGLATKGLLGGGGIGGGMPKGKAGLLALPLLALAPLLMGAGNKNNNSPTSEFRREQGVRRTRKNIISSGDTDRFGMQLDRFERILDNMGGRKRPKSNINEKMELDLSEVDDTKKDKKDINGQIADALDLLNPFSALGDIGKPIEQKKEPEEEALPPIENDFEIELKQKPEPKEIEKPFDNLEIIVKKKPIKKTFNVSTVLKDLENKDQEFKKEQETIEEKQEEVFTEKVGPSMTISEIDLLKQQLHGCLNLNVGVANLKEIKPVIYIEVNPDRTVKNAKVVNQERLIDPSFRTAAEAAMRAVNNPECSPLLLPQDKYETWKEINFTFDFSWMSD